MKQIAKERFNRKKKKKYKRDKSVRTTYWLHILRIYQIYAIYTKKIIIKIWILSSSLNNLNKVDLIFFPT